MKKATTTEAEIHFDLSSPFKESIHKNTYALHLLDGRTSFSEAHAIPPKVKLSNIVRGFVNKFNNTFSTEFVKVRIIRADNARENIPNKLHEPCTYKGMYTELSSAYAPKSNGTA